MSKQINIPSEDDILDPEEMYLTVELEDGQNQTFRILNIFDVSDQSYICVYIEDDPENLYFYRYFEDEEGNPSIDNIESDEEFDAVSDRFDMILDDAEFDTMK